MKDLELRMYGLVNYQLTGIQKGIQFLHAVVEYGQKYGHTPEYKNWANNYKTVILLNGGTTSNRIVDGIYFGTINRYKAELDDMGVANSAFYEPDLGDQLTSIAFMVDERVFNRKLYPDFPDWLIYNYGYDNLKVDDRLSKFEVAQMVIESNSKGDRVVYREWLDSIGGESILKFREFLEPFRLA